MPENRVLRSTFGTTVKEVTVEWRKLHSEELHEDLGFRHSGIEMFDLRTFCAT
jgi:hypothetical protein